MRSWCPPPGNQTHPKIMVLIQKLTEITVFVLGLVLFLIGALLSQFWEVIIQYNFNKNLPLRPDSESFNQWRRTPIPLFMKVYFWNWTNAREAYERGDVPTFDEVGPYVFREVHEKVNLTWNENGTITFRTLKKWYFESDMTNGTLGDNITSVNVVAASASYMTRDMTRFFLYPLSVVLRSTGQKVWWTRNVSELLFEGFDNPIQKMGTYLSSKAGERFGFFYQKNGTLPEDVINMGTGTTSIDELGELKYWNYNNKSDLYPGCRDIYGSTGEFWPSKNTKDRPQIMYSTDMCRQVRLYYVEETRYNGLDAYVYAGTEATVDNGSAVEENKCYCEGKCPPSGVFDVSKCQDGAPIFLSYPHFYDAHRSYSEGVRGMKPDKAKHRYYVTIEPRTGIQLEVAARMQINVYLVRNTGLSLFRNITDVFVPVLWLDTHVALGEQYTDGLVLMMKLIQFGPFISYGLLILGTVVVAILCLLHFTQTASLSCVKRNLKKSNEQYRASKEETTLYQFPDNTKEEIKYVLPEEKL